MMTERSFKGTDAAKLAGITYRQLDYWARTDMIRPSIADAWGSGSRRLYSERDVLLLKIARIARDSGISLDRVRQCMDGLEGHNLREGDWIVMAGERLIVSGEPSPTLEDLGDGPIWIIRIRLEDPA